MKSEEIEKLILLALPDAKVIVTGADNSNRCGDLAIAVSSAAFAEQSLLQQHRMVYKALGDVVGTSLHSVKLSTRQA